MGFRFLRWETELILPPHPATVLPPCDTSCSVSYRAETRSHLLPVDGDSAKQISADSKIINLDHAARVIGRFQRGDDVSPRAARGSMPGSVFPPSPSYSAYCRRGRAIARFHERGPEKGWPLHRPEVSAKGETALQAKAPLDEKEGKGGEIECLRLNNAV